MGVDLMGVPPRLAALESGFAGIAAAAGAWPWKVTAVPSGRIYTAAVTYSAATAGASVSLGTNTTLQTLVSVVGSGVLRFCSLACTGTSAATLRLVIEIDGTAILDYTSPSASAARSLFGVGAMSVYTYSAVAEWEIFYRSSLVIKAQQSAAVTSTLYYTNILAAPYTA